MESLSPSLFPRLSGQIGAWSILRIAICSSSTAFYTVFRSERSCQLRVDTANCQWSKINFCPTWRKDTGWGHFKNKEEEEERELGRELRDACIGVSTLCYTGVLGYRLLGCCTDCCPLLYCTAHWGLTLGLTRAGKCSAASLCVATSPLLFLSFYSGI